MTEIEEREVYLIPAVGTVVTLQNASEVARALSDVRDLESQLRDAKRVLTDALVEESRRRGSKTLELGRMSAESRGGVDDAAATEKLEQGLLSLGCPDDLLREIVKEEVSYKVDARRASRAATANPEYAAVIKAARTEIEKPHTIVLRKAATHGEAA